MGDKDARATGGHALEAQLVAIADGIRAQKVDRACQPAGNTTRIRFVIALGPVGLDHAEGGLALGHGQPLRAQKALDFVPHGLRRSPIELEPGIDAGADETGTLEFGQHRTGQTGAVALVCLTFAGARRFGHVQTGGGTRLRQIRRDLQGLAALRLAIGHRRAVGIGAETATAQ